MVRFQKLSPLSIFAKSSILDVWLTAQKMKFSNENLFIRCDQMHRKLRIWLHLLKRSLMVNFIFCAVTGFWILISVPLRKGKKTYPVESDIDIYEKYTTWSLKMNYYSDTYSKHRFIFRHIEKNFILALATTDFL